ncbi:AAA domain-containing protein, partial [Tribonema minus]
GVRVATIDNYQGEEADVVIVSLVRSRASGTMGFLSDANRLNVALSRARRALIVIGDLDFLTQRAKGDAAREPW